MLKKVLLSIVDAVLAMLAIGLFLILILLTGAVVFEFKDNYIVAEIFSKLASNPLHLPVSVENAFSSYIAFGIALMFFFAKPFAKLLTLITERTADKKMINMWTKVIGIICMIMAIACGLVYVSDISVIGFIIYIFSEHTARKLEKEKSLNVRDDLIIHVFADIIRMTGVIFMAFVKGGTIFALMIAISIPLVRYMKGDLEYFLNVIKEMERTIKYMSEKMRRSNPIGAYSYRVYDRLEEKFRSYMRYMKYFMYRKNFPVAAHRIKLC